MRSGLIGQESSLPTYVGAGTPPISKVRIFTVHSPHTQITAPSSIIATMVRIDHNSDFERIRERRKQVYAIERELIIFTKLIVVNKARLRHFDKHSLRSASDVCPICTAECRASLVEVKLLRYLGRPPKGQTEGAIHVDDPHFTSWLLVYMLTDIHSPLIDPNLRNVDMQGDTIDMYSLPIRRPRQQCLRAVCDALQEALLPPPIPFIMRAWITIDTSIDYTINRLVVSTKTGIVHLLPTTQHTS
jgi:hypothetical protein